MSSEKKCPNCGEWSQWNGEINDVCTHCGSNLSPFELKEKARKDQENEENDKKWMFHYEPDAPWYIKLSKKSGYVVYSIIMAIVSFIMYLFFWLGP